VIASDLTRAWVARGQAEGHRYHLSLPRRASHGRTGLHLGVGRGASVEFHEHREYQPGDDLRHLDWNVSARSDRLVVKLYREEVNPSFDLVVDGSRSMALPGTAKAEVAVTTAALLCTAAAGAGWRHATWYTAAVCERVEPSALYSEAWNDGVFGAPVNPGAALLDRPPQWRPRSARALISDLLWPGDPEPVLRRLASGAAAAPVLCVVSRDDLAPPLPGRLRLVDSESAAELPVEIDDATINRYRQAVARHSELWQRAAQGLGVAFVVVIAEDLVARWDLAPLVDIGLLQAAP
jgi:hypothetical protein